MSYIFFIIKKCIFLTILFEFTYSSISFADTNKLQLTPAEKKWLSEHPVIRIGVDAGYAPYSFLDSDGTFIGVAPDFINLLSKKLGVSFKVTPDLSWPEIVQGARDHSLDVIATAVITEKRKSFLNFTQIYIPTPLVIMSRSDDMRFKAASDIKNHTVALVEGYSSSKRVIQEHPAAKVIQVANPVEGLHAVSSGLADIYVGVLGINIYLSQKQGITNLKVSANYDVETNGQRFAVRKDWKILTAILDKALNSITEAERKKIYDKWIDVPYIEQVDYSLLWKAILLFLIIVIIMYLHSRRLQLEISRRQIIEERLLNSNKQLEHARKLADIANKAKSEFLAMMSHELRTPLTSIKGALGILSSDEIKQSSEESKKMLKIAYNNSNHLAFLVDDILDFEKLQSGNMVLEKEAIQLCKLIEHAVTVNQSYADKYKVGLLVKKNNCSEIQVNADHHRLLQVLSNFISNAIKFSPSGEMVEVELSCSENNVRVTVADKGKGVPKEFYKSIFNHFSQADSSDSREKGGSGLGLAISKEIIEQHNGKIGFDSEEGKGSKFYFELEIV